MLIAAVQMASGPDRTKNLEVATRLVRRAAERGAVLVGLPENVAWMGSEKDRASAAERLDGPSLTRFAELARQLRIHLLAGSIMEAGAPGGRVHNTSVLLGPEGQQLAVYRKIHLFDAEVGDGASYRESDTVAPGEAPVTAETPLGTVGLSICYDLRFPELYRELTKRGAEVLLVPAAFTLHTGKDHWHVLLRARAIEAQSYVVAAAQWGKHPLGRVTYGHALIADPWGTVLAEAPDGIGFALAELDGARLRDVRASLPSLQHQRLSRV